MDGEEFLSWGEGGEGAGAHPEHPEGQASDGGGEGSSPTTSGRRAENVDLGTSKQADVEGAASRCSLLVTGLPSVTEGRSFAEKEDGGGGTGGLRREDAGSRLTAV